MKKIALFLIFFVFVVYSVSAQKSVALHSNGTTTVFSGNTPLTEAYHASVTGDTLYVSGGNFTAPTTIDKGLVIIGAGYNVDSTAVTQPTILGGGINITHGTSNIYLEGVELLGQVNCSGTINGFTFIRCKFSEGLIFSANSKDDGSIIQCIIEKKCQLQYVSNSLVSNCIIKSQITYSQNNVIKNNVFVYDEGTSWPTTHCISNAFINNIFSSNAPVYVWAGNSNNFKFNVFPLAPDLGPSAIDLNNYKSIDLATVYVNAAEEDYHLLTNAATTYKGDDDTQVGIYGGMLPLKEGGVPSNPHISQKAISSTSGTNGFLNVTFKVNAQQ